MKILWSALLHRATIITRNHSARFLRRAARGPSLRFRAPSHAYVAINHARVVGCVALTLDNASVAWLEPEVISRHVTAVYGDKCEI